MTALERARDAFNMDEWVAVADAMPADLGVSGGTPCVWARNGVAVALGMYNRKMAERMGYTHWYHVLPPPRPAQTPAAPGT